MTFAESVLLPKRRRSQARRGTVLPCRAMALRGLSAVGVQILDLSPDGMLVHCVRPVDVGERLLVRFRSPRAQRQVDAFGKVTRVIVGRRPSDPSFAAGVRFTQLCRLSRAELSEELVGIPPPIPKRPLTVDYAASVRSILLG